MSTLDEVKPDAGREAVLRLVPPQEVAMLRQSVAAIAARFGRAYFARITEEGSLPTELWSVLGEGGFLGINIATQYGGGGLGLSELHIVAEELAAAGCPMLELVLCQTIAGSVLTRHATAEQRQRWLPGIAAGKHKLAVAMTEPDAGTNFRNLTTRAVRDGDAFVLKGTKTYISGVEGADTILVGARTARPGRNDLGLSLFMVDADATGLQRQHVPVALRQPEKQWTLYFDDVIVSADRLIGGENQGLVALFDGLIPERIMVAALSAGIGRYALEKAVAYAKQRAVWGVPIGTHQAVAHPLAQAQIELSLAKLMIEKAAALYDAGLDASESANAAKYAAAEAGIHCLDQAIQTHGGNGLALEYGLTDLWWLARLFRIAPIPREMILNTVAERVLGLPKSY